MLKYSTIQHDKMCTFKGLPQQDIYFSNKSRGKKANYFREELYLKFDNGENNLKIIEYKSLLNKSETIKTSRHHYRQPKSEHDN